MENKCKRLINCFSYLVEYKKIVKQKQIHNMYIVHVSNLFSKLCLLCYLIMFYSTHKNTLWTTYICVFKFHFCANRFKQIMHWNLRGTPHSWVKCRLSNCFRYWPLYLRPQLFGQTAGSCLQISSNWRHSVAAKMKTWDL